MVFLLWVMRMNCVCGAISSTRRVKRPTFESSSGASTSPRGPKGEGGTGERTHHTPRPFSRRPPGPPLSPPPPPFRARRGPLLDKAGEAADVRVVERGVDFVEDAEGRGLVAEDGDEQRQRRQRLLAAREQ